MMNHDDDILDNTKFANLCRHLKKAAIETPNLLAVAVQKYRSGGLSYDEIDFYQLDQQSDAIAYALNSYGIKRGMKAVLMVTPSLDFFALTFALFKAGIIPILVDPGMGVKNLKQCFIESSPDAFIGIPKAHIARKLFGWGKNSVKFLLTVGNAGFWGGISLANLLKRSAKQDINKPQNKPYPITWLDQDEMAAILFTSGSTGVPKGVVYSHKMFEAQINALKVDYGIISGERDLATFPLFSLFGPALGMASIVPDMDASKPITANPDYIFAAIEKYQCSNLFANPALIEVLGQAGKLNNHHLPSLKRVISAGAPATLSSIACFSKMLNEDVEVLNSYGATESLPLTKIGSKALLTTTAITDTGGGICVGNAVKGVEVTIIAITENDISQWDDNLCLPMNQIGEIVVKGAMVSQSYYQREIATKQAKIADYPLDYTLSANRQYRHRMGDLGYLDEQGQLWMCGRKAHRVQTSSDVVFSIPCERIFNTHAKVKRSALVGVKIKDKITPLLCIELDNNNLNPIETKQLFNELQAIGKQYQASQAIQNFLIHPDFPVDIRHNAKIFREKLAVWAQKQIAGKH